MFNLAADPAHAALVEIDKTACLWLYKEQHRLLSREQIQQKLAAMEPNVREQMRAALNRNKNKFRSVA